MSAYIYRETTLDTDQVGEIRVWQRMRYGGDLPEKHRLWQINTFADQCNELTDDEWAWLGTHCSELIEIDPTDAAGVFTQTKDRDDWNWHNDSGDSVLNRTYGTDDGHSLKPSNLFKCTENGGGIGDYAFVSIEANEGDSIDVSCMGPTLTRQNSYKITVTKGGVPVTLNGRGFDSGRLVSISAAGPAGYKSRSFARPWDADGVIAPFNWSYNENHRLEVLRDAAAGTYIITVQQTGEESDNITREFGLFTGRVVSRRPATGWLDPSASNVRPRFEEHEPWRTTLNDLLTGHSMMMSHRNSLPCATQVDGGDFWGGTAHGEITQNTKTIKVDEGSGYSTKALGDLDAGFNGPYVGVRFSLDEWSDVVGGGGKLGHLLQFTMSGTKMSCFGTLVSLGEYLVAASYMNVVGFARNDWGGYRPPLNGDDTTFPYIPTAYEWRENGTEGTPAAWPPASSDSGHGVSEDYVVHFGNLSSVSPRLYVNRTTSIRGGNISDGALKKWVDNASGKMYTTIMQDSSIGVLDGVFVQWESFFADEDYIYGSSAGESGIHWGGQSSISGASGLHWSGWVGNY